MKTKITIGIVFFILLVSNFVFAQSELKIKVNGEERIYKGEIVTLNSQDLLDGTKLAYWTISLKRSKYSDGDSFSFSFPPDIEKGDYIQVISKPRSVWTNINLYDMTQINVTYIDIRETSIRCCRNIPPTVSSSNPNGMPYFDGHSHQFEIIFDEWDPSAGIAKGRLQGFIKVDYQSEARFTEGVFSFTIPRATRY